MGDNTLIPADLGDQDGDMDTAEPVPFDQRGMGFDRIQGGTVDIGAFEAEAVAPNGPEINLQGMGQDIADGDTGASVADGTDFGLFLLGESAVTHTFTIQNAGNADLNLTGTPIVEVVGHPDFTVSVQPASNTVAAMGSTTFGVTFTPNTAGNPFAEISIANDDADENPYNFVVTATVEAGESLTWVGDVDENWEGGESGTDTNWDTDTLPEFGNTLIFPAEGFVQDLNNDTIDGSSYTLLFTGGSYTITGNQITLDNSGVDINVTGGDHHLAVPLFLDATEVSVDSSILLGSAGEFSIGGDGGLTISGSGTATVVGNNFFSGDVSVTDTATLVAGNMSDDTIPDSATVDVGATASFSILGGGANEAVNALTGSGSVSIGDSDLLTLAPSGGSSTFSGAISGDGSLQMGGTGTQILSGDNSYAGGTLMLGGVLQVDGSLTSGVSWVNGSGGTLAGSGTINAAVDMTGTSGGAIAPGAPTGELTVNGLVTLASGGSFDVELTSSSDHDKLITDQTPDLGDATLNVSLLNYTGAANDTFVILENTGAGAAPTTTFAGLAEGATLTVDGTDFTISYVGGDGNDVVLTVGGVTVAPEINVQGNGQDILDGDTTPDAADDTDFGSAEQGAAAVTHTFTIQNTGDGDLNLTATPIVAISGSSDFTVSMQPAGSTVAAMGSTTFDVTFTPMTEGVQTATISIANDDDDENPYDFVLQGTVTLPPPEINVQGNGQDIADGDTTPDVADSTDFGSAEADSGAIVHTFTIQNTGGSDLNLAGTPIVAISGSNDFTVSMQPAGNTVAAMGSTTFDVTFTPTTIGTQTATISITNDDADENPYDFVVQGEVTEPGPPDLQIIDDGDPTRFNAGGFTRFESATNPQGFVGDDGVMELHFSKSNSIKQAIWTFTVTPGIYRVSTTWSPHPNRATNAPFAVFDGTVSGTVAAAKNINQRVAPDDFVDAGAPWEDITQEATITGTTLTVRLRDWTTNGVVIADAIRVERIIDPEIDVTDVGNGNAPVANAGTVDLGGVQQGATTTHKFRIANLGSGDLGISDVSISNTDGMAFSLSPDPDPVNGNGKIGFAGSSDFTIALDTSVNDTYTATITIVSNDADEGTYTFQVSATVANASIIDNSDPGFSAPGFVGFGTGYTTNPPQGLNGNVHYHAAANFGTTAASWTFEGLSSGTYQVAVTWTAHANRAYDVKYQIPGTQTLVVIDQRKEPSTVAGAFESDGVFWVPLDFQGNGGNYGVTESTLQVTMGTSNKGYVIADAVRIEKLQPLMAADEQVLGEQWSAVSDTRSGARSDSTLDAATLTGAVNAAVVQWSAVDTTATARLANVRVDVANLPVNVLGLASEGQQRIWIDSNAAGHGWALNRKSQIENQKSIDLLTVVRHELGHVLGLPDLRSADHPRDVMADRLDAGLRRLPDMHEMSVGEASMSRSRGLTADRLFADLGDWFADRDSDPFGKLGAGRRETAKPAFAPSRNDAGTSLAAGGVWDVDDDDLFTDIAERQAERRDENMADQLFAEPFDEVEYGDVAF